MKRKQKKFIYFIVVAILALILKFIDSDTPITNTTFISPYDGKLHVYYLDVGQADSIFIKLPNNENMLIDAGVDESGEKIVEALQSSGTEKIDYLVATHPHADHIGGMQEVVENFDIGKVYMPAAVTNTRTYEDLLLAIKSKGNTITTAKAGTDILSDENLSAVFVAPNSAEYDDLNNYSAVIKLTYGNNSFVFTGDAEKLSEDEIRANIKCDVLKVGHHGSNTSTSKNFLKKTEPTYAVISCGADNEYGHPHKEVMQRLNNAGIEIYRTDVNGTIEAVSDGNNITFNVERD